MNELPLWMFFLGAMFGAALTVIVLAVRRSYRDHAADRRQIEAQDNALQEGLNRTFEQRAG